MQTQHYVSGRFRLTALAAAMSCAVSSLSFAEDGPQAPQDGKAPVVEPIVVTGMKSVNLKSIAAKQDSDLIVDTVAADQVGKLPDFNVGDALRRVTGVNVLLYQGEPRYLILRGLDGNYNTTLIDGFSLASGDVGSRQQLMEMLPSNLASRLDVTKTFLPESDGGAIGGVVNMVTANAFSLRDNTLTLDAKLGKNLMAEQYGGYTPTGEMAAKWDKRLGEHNEFALLVSASYWSRDIYVPQVESGGTLNWYNANGSRSATAYGGNGIAVPTQRLWYDYDDSRERGGLTARLDWEPSDTLSGHISMFDFKQHEESDRNTQNASVNAASTVSNQTPTSGTLSSVNQLAQLGRLKWDRNLDGINGELDYQPSQDWKTDLRASTSRSTVYNPQTWDVFTQSNMPFNYSWSGSGAPVFVPVNAAKANDPSLYPLTYHQETAQQYNSIVHDLQLDAKNNASGDSKGFGYAFGTRFVQTNTDSYFNSANWTGMPYTLANVLGTGSLCGLNCNANLMLINPGLADNYLNQYRNSAKVTVNTASQYGSTYGVSELVSAAYAEARFKGSNWLAEGGLRFEHTRDAMDGWSQQGGVWGAVGSANSYGNLLPSAIFVYDTSEESKLRIGLSKTIGRPRWDQLATTGGTLSSGNNPTLTEGNADLKPRSSENFDIGHDWYLDQGRGIFSVAAFHKVIHNEIFTFGADETLDVFGTPTQVLVTQPRNSPNTVLLNGVEFGFTKDLDFIGPAFKGLGISANATFSKAQYPVILQNGTATSTAMLSALPEQPKQMWNMTLYYESAGIHARLAWNHLGALWDDRYPNYTLAGFYANRYQQATNNVDFQFSYDVSKRLALTLDALNLTGQGMQYNYGYGQQYQQSAWKLAPSVMLGFNYKM
ncbi:MAG TPA: TonB-dependent receptor [Burkholderiaceae bacterium]